MIKLLQEGTLLKSGDYRIERVLGQGGFGITYLATQVGLNRKVAIKEFFMKEYCNRDETTSHVSVPSDGSKELVSKFKTKFIKEAQTIAGLENNNIIRIHDVFEENGTAYYVMEYLSNGDLRSRIPSDGISEAEAVGYIKQLCSALSYIHSNNILHLDIKPGNVLFRQSGEAVLIDFGVSKHYEDDGDSQTTTTTPVCVSHGYAPTEQYETDGVSSFSAATDIYALGATLYCLIVGERPPKASVVLNNGLPGKPSGVSSGMWHVIESSMRPAKKDRPQSISEFLQLLDGVASDSEETELTDLGEESSKESIGTTGSSSTSKSTVSGSKSSLSKSRDVGQSSSGSNVSGFSHQDNSSSKSPVSNGKKKKGMFYGIIGCILASVITVVILLSLQNNHNALIENSPSDSIALMQSRLDSLQLVADQEKSQREQMAQEQAAKEQAEAERKERERLAAEQAAAEQARLAQQRAEAERKAAEQAEAERKARESAQYKSSGRISGHEYVDLGLSVKWATCNVGAVSPEGYGSYFAWGETSPKSFYDWDTYKYSSSSTYDLTKYCDDSDCGYNGYADTKTKLDLIDDAARANWGGSWRMPTRAEQDELRAKCTWTWTTLNGINGYKVTSKSNGNSIFLPAAGCRFGTGVYHAGSDGDYWSSSLYSSDPDYAYYLSSGSDDVDWGDDSRCHGYPVRAVCP